jgi:hypothetical protein
MIIQDDSKNLISFLRLFPCRRAKAVPKNFAQNVLLVDDGYIPMFQHCAFPLGLTNEIVFEENLSRYLLSHASQQTLLGPLVT